MPGHGFQEGTLDSGRSFEQLLEFLPDAIVVVRRDGSVELLNDQAEELLGYARGELRGELVEVLVPERLRNGHPGSRREYFENPHIRPMGAGVELYVRCKSGSEFPAEISLSTIEVGGGKIAIAAVRDISERAESERERVLEGRLAGVRAAAIEDLRVSRLETVGRLAKAIELHDPNTGGHVTRMAAISSFLAGQSGMEPERVDLIRAAAPMHDVGKIGVPREILTRPGALTPSDRRVMERHARIGHDLLSGSESELVRLSASIALTHHERWDGSGYPEGLKGEEIPIEGRLVAVADVFDALLSDRSYRPAMSVADAVEVIREGRGSHFDPRFVDYLLEHLEEALSLRG